MPTPQRLVRRRTRQVMSLFYRMLGTYLRHEKVLVRFASTSDAREALRKRMWTRVGSRYRDTSIAQGGLFIKVGQILSARSDIFPREFTHQLSSLQDEVPGVPFEAIQGVVEEEFARPIADVFATFDPTPWPPPLWARSTRPPCPTASGWWSRCSAPASGT